jgi:hypothetical protein
MARRCESRWPHDSTVAAGSGGRDHFNEGSQQTGTFGNPLTFARAFHRPLYGAEFEELNGDFGSATPVRLIELLTYLVYRMSSEAARP